MQMIQGTDIRLVNDESSEIIRNVLIGEPVNVSVPVAGQILQYTLGIPKGDGHNFEDRILQFFGRRWRTVGKALEGITANIPLSWDKNIQVQELSANSCCTVFSKNNMTSHFFPECFVSDSRSSVTGKDGRASAGQLNLLIYGLCGCGYRPLIGDIIVIGECSFEFDTTSEQSFSESMAQFRQLYPGYAIVKESAERAVGIEPDIIVTAA